MRRRGRRGREGKEDEEDGEEEEEEEAVNEDDEERWGRRNMRTNVRRGADASIAFVFANSATSRWVAARVASPSMDVADIARSTARQSGAACQSLGTSVNRCMCRATRSYGGQR
eukprot:9485917-Pyramimonas_sp.AAC.1